MTGKGLPESNTESFCMRQSNGQRSQAAGQLTALLVAVDFRATDYYQLR